MRQAARTVVAHNLVDVPILLAGKFGTAEFGVSNAEGRVPYHSWFVGFLPEIRTTALSRNPDWQCRSWPSPTTSDDNAARRS